jgi:predicted nicotinamide N-methyase
MQAITNDEAMNNDIMVGDLFDMSTPVVAVNNDRASIVSVALDANSTMQLEQNERAVAETGGTVWQAGIELAHWLSEHAQSMGAFDAALDLGCGSGVAGVACALLLRDKVPRVCFCDFDATALLLARQNCTRNLLAPQTEVEFVCASMQACAAQLPLDLQSDTSRLLVLASDVCYDAQSEQGLVDALTALLRNRRGESRAVIALQERGDLLVAFEERLPSLMTTLGFEVTVERRSTATGKVVCIFDVVKSKPKVEIETNSRQVE